MPIAAVFKPWLLHTLPAAVGPTDMPHGIEGEAQGSTAAEDALGASCHLEIHDWCVLHPLGMCGDNYFNNPVTTIPPWFVFMLFNNAMYIWLYGGKSWFFGNKPWNWWNIHGNTLIREQSQTFKAKALLHISDEPKKRQKKKLFKILGFFLLLFFNLYTFAHWLRRWWQSVWEQLKSKHVKHISILWQK